MLHPHGPAVHLDAIEVVYRQDGAALVLVRQEGESTRLLRLLVPAREAQARLSLQTDTYKALREAAQEVT